MKKILLVHLNKLYEEWQDSLNEEFPDPLLVARTLDDERAILTCALFSYGNAKAIVKFLRTLDFTFNNTHNTYYRFQTQTDIAQFFTTLRHFGKDELYTIFIQTYEKNNSILEALNELITEMYRRNPYRSHGYDFLLSRPFNPAQSKGVSALKRWMLFLRWMVRTEKPDLGKWRDINPCDLILPLDVHTFRVSQKLGLLQRKTYDLQAALEVTKALKKFDSKDPTRYDFALYRAGQYKNFS